MHSLEPLLLYHLLIAFFQQLEKIEGKPTNYGCLMIVCVSNEEEMRGTKARAGK